MSSIEAAQEDNELDFDTLDELRADGEGPLDHPCPLCGPDRASEFNRTRPTLRTWEPEPGFITYYCARCEAKGYAHAGAEQTIRRPAVRASQPKVPPADDTARLFYVERIWSKAWCDLPEKVVAYFVSRGIHFNEVPKGVLRFHPECPWHGKKTGLHCRALYRCADRGTARYVASLLRREADDARPDGRLCDPLMAAGGCQQPPCHWRGH